MGPGGKITPVTGRWTAFSIPENSLLRLGTSARLFARIALWRKFQFPDTLGMEFAFFSLVSYSALTKPSPCGMQGMVIQLKQDRGMKPSGCFKVLFGDLVCLCGLCLLCPPAQAARTVLLDDFESADIRLNPGGITCGISIQTILRTGRIRAASALDVQNFENFFPPDRNGPPL